MEVYERSNLVESMWPDWCMLETLRGGTRAMRNAGRAYLPQWPAEDDESYRARLNSSFLFNALDQTVESMSGRPFTVPLTLNNDIPAVIESNLDDVDLEGRNFHTFARDLFRAGLAYGHALVLVDFPTTTGARSQADLKIAGARPYMQLIFPQQVMYWHAERINGVMMLTEVRIWELLDNQAGWFSELPVMQIRVIKRDSFEVWRPQVVADNKPAVWVAEETGPNTLGHIPLVPFYAKRTGYFTSRPPLIDLAELNVEHWQSSSDQRNILHVARVPLLTVTSDDEDFSLSVGASRALRLPTSSKAEFVETKGASIAAGRQDLLDIEERMRQIGADLISLNVGRMAATQASILDSRSQSKLGAMAQSLEDALNLALYEWAQWIGADNGGTVEVFKDFGVDLTNAQDEAVLLNAANAGKLSNQTFYEELQRRGTLADTVSWEEEQARQQEQGPQLGALGNVFSPRAPAGDIGNPANTAANAGGLNGNGE